MRATGIVRRIDELGRVVIPKEIRRTLRIREGDPLEIYTDRDGEVILKKYSPIGEMSSFAKDYTESLFRSLGHIAVIVDRDQVVAASGLPRKELGDKPISRALETAIASRQTVALNQQSGGRMVAVTTEEDQNPNYTAQVGDLDLIRNGRSERKLLPEKRVYPTSSMPMTEAAIDIGLFRDVYVSLGEPIDKARPEGAWVVRVYFKPFVDWIWGGCVLMSLGGLLAIFDRRYRVVRRQTAPVAAVEIRP